MKAYPIFFFAIILCSCGNNTRKQVDSQTQLSEENWRLAEQIILKNTFNKLGAIDTTYKTQNIYTNDRVGVILKFIILRKYDPKNNLVSERTFQVLRKNELSEDKKFTYNLRNNLIEEITRSDNVVSSIIIRTYNDLDQEIKRIEITRIPELNPENWNLDSGVSHHNDTKESPLFDTTIISTFYNEQGNIIKQSYSGPNETAAVESILTEYINGHKTSMYSIYPNGDTSSVTTFEISGTQLKAIKEDKQNSSISETSWYENNKLVKNILIDTRMKWREMKIYKYDSEGNLVETISYK